MSMDDKPQVTRVGIFSMQVCVPKDWGREDIERFANMENLCGTTNGWVLCQHPEVAPIACEGRQGFVHVILDC
jgi:hypothetical protein